MTANAGRARWRRPPWWWYVAIVVIFVLFLVAACTTPSAGEPPPPAQPPNVDIVVIHVDGYDINCAVRSTQGINCDWAHRIVSGS